MYLLICWVAEERNFAVKSIRRYSKNVGIRFRVIDVKDYCTLHSRMKGTIVVDDAPLVLGVTERSSNRRHKRDYNLGELGFLGDCHGGLSHNAISVCMTWTGLVPTLRPHPKSYRALM